ncbi:hypothetical protein [Intrasporangium oryzae]|uniref:hypothetical protein n=1 Tax=Intrasporangium oryzae TaxID=412687 RepID=UPI0004BC0C31|nr:hypothetical protein [Intrasporangium oryzae]
MTGPDQPSSAAELEQVARTPGATPGATPGGQPTLHRAIAAVVRAALHGLEGGPS